MNAAVVLLSLVLALLALEGAIRLIAPQNLYPVSFADDPAVGHRYRPNIKGVTSTQEYRIRLETNSQGLRDEEHPVVKPPGTLRILAIGDSFTAGDGVELEQAFHQVLEERLSQASERGRYEAINAGVSGWGPSNGLAFLLSEGFRYSPDLLLVQVFVDHYNRDLSTGLFALSEDGSLRRLPYEASETSNVRAMARRLPFYSYLAQNSHLLNIVRQQAVRALWGRKQVQVRQEVASLSALSSQEPFKLSLAVLGGFDDYAKSQRIPWALIIVAPWQQVMGEPRTPMEDQFYKALLHWARDRGVRVVDTAGILKDQGDPRDYYHLKDGHFNVRGNRLMGDTLFRELGAELLAASEADR